MTMLVAENLGKRFGRRQLFRKLSFSLEAGNSMAVTGANGAGKSTLLCILARVIVPSSGQVRLEVNGNSVSAELHPFQIGLVAPYLNVYDGFSARENLEFLANVRRLDDATQRINSVLDLVSLSHRAGDRVGTFSSGMKQRVKYAAALLAEPLLLLLDEPSSNLDEAGLAMVQRVMDHQRNSDRILVVATNDPREADKCDRAIRIEDYR